MSKQSYPKGTVLHSTYEQVNSLEILLSGVVKLTGSNCTATISSGGIIGALETPGTQYSYSYEVIEDAVVFDYPYTKVGELEKIIASNHKIAANISASTMRTYLEICHRYQSIKNEAAGLHRFIEESYQNYKSLCERFRTPTQTLSGLDEMPEPPSDDTVPNWEISYFYALRSLDAAAKQSLFSTPNIGTGLILSCIQATERVIAQLSQDIDYLSEITSTLLSSDGMDFFDLYSNLVFNASRNPFADTTPIEAAVSKLIIFLQSSEFLDPYHLNRRIEDYRNRLQQIEDQLLSEDSELPLEKEACDDLDHSLDTILSFADMPVEIAMQFRDQIEQFRLLPDRNDTGDKARKLRKDISSTFYQVYENAFFNSLKTANVPIPVKMFFYFGYVDEELCGLNNAVKLYEMAKNMTSDPTGVTITVYDWLKLIYNGKEEPSRNEFDLDYPAYLRELKANGTISSDEEKLLLYDRKRKVSFEIENFFRVGNRITYGRISTFCPVLSDHNIIRSLDDTFVTPEKVISAIDAVRSVDFSCFYRTTVYTNPERGVQKEYIDVEVLPHIILMPNIGVRGALWQETSDSRRDSSGRMMLSIFHTENPADQMLRVCAEFRWELCKRIQGVHWNDVTDPSLTSEFCDYIQFYRKNRDLSSDAKEKLKASLAKAKNNYRDVFVMNYTQWIKYEGSGSPRLNKIARGILFRYCPFPKSIRDTLASNPLYQDLFEKYRIKQAQAIHQLDLQIQKIEKGGFSVPKEVLDQMDYLNR